VLPPVSEAWLAAVRDFFVGWVPEDACRLLTLRDHPSVEKARVLSALDLARVHPVLMGMALRSWLSSNEAVCRPAPRATITEQTGPRGLRTIRMTEPTVCEKPLGERVLTKLGQALGMSSEPGKSVSQLQEDASIHAARALGVDQAFFEHGLLERAVLAFKGGRLRAIERDNLAVSLACKPVRDCLALCILKEVQQLVGD
jgi:hypothetical protein